MPTDGTSDTNRDLDQVTQRTGGRSARIRREVLDATLAVLASDGYAGVTLDRVAERAGVHRTTLLRRWGTPIALVLDALFDRADATIGTIDTGSYAGDVRALLDAVRANLSSAIGEATAVALAAERSEEVAEGARVFWQRRFHAVGPIVERAVARGELPVAAATDPSRIIERLVAPLFFRVLVQHRPIDDALVDDVVGAADEHDAAVVVRVTCGDRAEAERIAQRLVVERLAACVHLSDLDSVYTWDGAVEHDHEVEVAVTTTTARTTEVVAAIEAEHSYDLPAIGWTPLGGTEGYLAWIHDSTTPVTSPT